jgi:hypothetical protein
MLLKLVNLKIDNLFTCAYFNQYLDKSPISAKNFQNTGIVFNQDLTRDIS